MKITLLFTLSFILLSFSIDQPNVGKTSVIQQAEEPFVSSDGLFQVAFSGEPAFSTQNVSTDIGEVEMGFYMYEKTAEEVYMVSYNSYDPKYIDEQESESLLSGGRDGALESLGIETANFQKFGKYQGYPSIDFNASNDNFAVIYKLVLVDNRLYQIAILTAGNILSEQYASRFMNSFKLLKD